MDTTPELLELDEDELLELELDDELLELLELLELDEDDEELLELEDELDELLLDELELLDPEEPVPPQADSSSARHIKMTDCFIDGHRIIWL